MILCFTNKKKFIKWEQPLVYFLQEHLVILMECKVPNMNEEAIFPVEN